MKKDEFDRRLKELRDPYYAWIERSEIRRKKGDVFLPEGYRLYSDADGYVDGALTEALREYNVFKDLYDFIYTDEDEENGSRHDPFFKPDFSPETLEEFYYPGGLSIVSMDIVNEVLKDCPYKPESREFLRECAKRSRHPLHIPEVLYHAYSHHDYSYAEKEKEETRLFSEKDVLSVVILSKDNPGILRKCVTGLMRSADKEKIALRCVIIDNGSSDENAGIYEDIADDFDIPYYREEAEFNYSYLCNLGVSRTRGRFLLFLNDDVEFPEDAHPLTDMMNEASKETVGAVGCKLLYPGGKKIQHCGITLLKTGASHKLAGYDDSVSWYRGVNKTKRNMFAVTGACLMLERRKFEEAGGFDERLEVAYTDVDLCAILITLGYNNVCLNDTALIHHESFTRKEDGRDHIKYARLKRERELFYKKHRLLIKRGDPFYNVNLTETGLDYRVNFPDSFEAVAFKKELPEASVSGGKLVNIISGKERELLTHVSNGKKILYNIDESAHLISDECGNEDVLRITGWAFVKGHPGYEYDIRILIKDGGTYYLCEPDRILRDDLKEVFPDENSLDLSGFSLKVEGDFFERLPEKGDISVILDKKGLFGRRGYIADES